MRKNLLGMLPLFVVLVLFSAGSCSVGLKSADKKMAVELNENLKGVQEELRILNQNLAELKALNPNLAGLTVVMTGVQDELKTLNETLSGFLKFRNPLSP